jgi:hypothetical protein
MGPIVENLTTKKPAGTILGPSGAFSPGCREPLTRPCLPHDTLISRTRSAGRRMPGIGSPFFTDVSAIDEKGVHFGLRYCLF